MTYLLDTHALLWLLVGDARLSATSKRVFTDAANEPLFSLASAWEVSIKASLGKLTLPGAGSGESSLATASTCWR